MKISPHELVIPDAKITQYLLVERIKNDKSKWLAQAGFTAENPEALTQAIIDMVVHHEATLDKVNEHGHFYRVVGDLIGINEVNLPSISVWLMVDMESKQYRFVTLKPK